MQDNSDGDLEMLEWKTSGTEPFAISADETLDIGMEMGSPVSPDYRPRGSAFNGEVNWVEIDVDKAALDQDHLISPEERLKVAMAQQ